MTEENKNEVYGEKDLHKVTKSTIQTNEESKSTEEHINLKVLGQDNNVVQFKIKKGTPLRKLMNAYCERCNLSMSTVRFRFDGQAINEQDTPASLEMEEGDTIEIYTQQTGGSYSSSIIPSIICAIPFFRSKC